MNNIREEFEKNTLRMLRDLDPDLSYIFDRIRRKMVKKSKCCDKPMPLPPEINFDDLCQLVESYYDYHDKIHETRISLSKKITYDDKFQYGVLDDFRKTVKVDVSRFELLLLALDFPGISHEDKKLFKDALTIIETRMKIYNRSKTEFKYLIKWFFAKFKNSGHLEAQAVMRAIILEAALSQGISEEEAEKRVSARWID
ncbi:MAG: hypothetical protein R2941_15215 [Desulfobacterales bacterium]